MAGLLTLAGLLLAPAALAGPLEDYLAEPVAEPSEAKGSHREAIRTYQEAFRKAEREYDKGIAVANLAFIALEMVRKPETREAGTELCSSWVVPNLSTTLPIEQTSSCCWRRTVMRCANLYKIIGDHETEKKCLALLYRGNRREGDKDLAVYLLAYQQARTGNHQAAIKTINHLKEDSKWARNRKKLIQDWTRHMNKQKNAKKP